LEPETGSAKSSSSLSSHETGHTEAIVILSFAAIVAPVIKIIGAFLVAIRNDFACDCMACPDRSFRARDLAIADCDCMYVDSIVAGGSYRR
jgi:hypothetical protein